MSNADRLLALCEETRCPCGTCATTDVRRARAALRVLVNGMRELSARHDDDVGPLAEVWLQVAAATPVSRSIGRN